MMRKELLSVDELAGMLAGPGARNAIAVLQSGQRTRNLLLLRGLLDLVDRDMAEDGAIAQFSASFSALCAVEAAAPRQVARLLAGPHFGSWVAACLRRLTGGEPAPAPPSWIDLAHLGALVISFAVAADVEAEAAVPSRSGRIVIPGVGCVLLDDAPGWQMAAIRRHADGTLTVRRPGATLHVPRDPPADSVSWQGIRCMRGSREDLQIELELDDLDPYRDCYGLRPAGRLTDDDAGRWQDQFARAWSVLGSRHREHAAAAAAVMRTVIPLTSRGAGRGVSATLRYASGAVSLTPQADETRLARTLVHELHHMKLNLLMDSIPLYRNGTDELFYSPWRDDPRPSSGLLHGLFAGVGEADFWRTECRGPDRGPLSDFELARIRRQVEIGLPVITRSTSFTSAGRAVIAAIQAAATAWHAEPLETYPAVLADDLVFDHLVRWRLRNLVPDDRDVAHLAAAWRRDQPPRSVPRTALVSGHRESFAEDARLRLAYRTLADGASSGGESTIGPASPADRHLVGGNYPAAATAYQAEISSGDASPDSWAGLTVSRRRLIIDGTDAIVMRPELVRALHDRLAAGSGRAPPPLDLARWLTPACLDDLGSGTADPAGIYLPVTLSAPQNRIPPGAYAPR